VRGLRRRDRSVAIVAVDPSSRRTGGALLGDRIRMRSGSGDPGVFIRSMAARDRLGGVAESTWAAVTILAAAFDCVFVETVGVGQSEGEVAELVDTLLFVANPGSGDMLQFMKAGLLELPDVFVVNKADAGASAQRTARELEAGLRLAEREANTWDPPVQLVSARDGSGVEALIETLDAHRRFAVDTGALRARRAGGRERFVTDALTRRYGSFGLARIGGAERVSERLRGDPLPSSFGAIEELGRAIEIALGSAN
jgi:LAO/AO transport system kinase